MKARHKTCLYFKQHLWDKLKKKAERNNRTLTGELMSILEKALEDKDESTGFKETFSTR